MCFVFSLTVAASSLQAQGNIGWEEMWKNLPPRGQINHSLSWMNDSLSFTGLVHDKTRDVIYVISPQYVRNNLAVFPQPRIYILDPDSGKPRMDLGRSAFPLNMGAGGELPVPLDTFSTVSGKGLGFARNRFTLFKIDVDDEGRICVCNLVNPQWSYCRDTSGTGCDPDYLDQGPFRVWRWDTPTSTPELIYATLNTAGTAIGNRLSSELDSSRWGDAFAVTGKRGWHTPPWPGTPVLHDSVRIYVSGGAWPDHAATNSVAVLVEDRRPLAQRPDRDVMGGGKLSFRLGVRLVQPSAGAASHGIAPEAESLLQGHIGRNIWMTGNTSFVTGSTEFMSSSLPIPQTWQPPAQSIRTLSLSLTNPAGPLKAFSLPKYQRRFLVVADGYPTDPSNPLQPNRNTTARALDMTTTGAVFLLPFGATPGIDTLIQEKIDGDNYVADVDYKIDTVVWEGRTHLSLILFVLMSNNGIACYRSRSPHDFRVELSAFHAAWTAEGVHLRWHVESETNALLFRIERGAAEGGPFEAAGTVAARGTTTIPAWYEFMDAGPNISGMQEQLWYRLVEVDTDGSQTIFPAVSVQRSNAPEALTLTLFPQPLRSNANDLTVYCESPHKQRVVISIHDILGRRIMTPLQRELYAGSNILVLGAAAFQPGTYLLVATFSDGSRQTRRIVVN